MTFPHSTLMVQGTTSDAGKSTVVAALCRLLKREGIKVAPFKPQNMALNSAVTADGGEIGRAQALQAIAAGVAPTTDMNPVLLKPSSDTGAQVIIHGKVRAEMNARDYHQYKTIAMQAVLESHQRLASQYDAVIVEGAGSPAEINLRDRDIANMGFAEAVDCPVILVADIDRGGVFAHIVGTLSCLSASRAGTHDRLRHQPLQGRHQAARTWPGLAGSADRQTGAGGAALSARAVPRCRGCGAAGAGVERRFPRDRSQPAAHEQSHRLRCAARPPGRRPCDSCAREKRFQRPI